MSRTRTLTLLAVTTSLATACLDEPDDGSHDVAAVVKVRGPHVALVQHIQGFNATDLLGQMTAAAPWGDVIGDMYNRGQRASAIAYATALNGFLNGLRATANPDSPWHLHSDTGRELVNGAWRNGKALSTYWNGQEYRGFIRLEDFEITCRDGQVVADAYPGNRPMAGGLRSNNGYTPDPLHLTYHAGEAHPSSPVNRYLRQADRVTWTAGVKARLDEPMRRAGFEITGYDAPFIYNEVKLTLACDGSYTVEADASYFPTATLYVNKLAASWRYQDRFVEFIKSGGARYNARGAGGLIAPGAKFATITGTATVHNVPGAQRVACDDPTTCAPGDAPVEGTAPTPTQPPHSDWRVCDPHGPLLVAPAVLDPSTAYWLPTPFVAANEDDQSSLLCRLGVVVWDFAIPTAGATCTPGSASPGVLPCGLLTRSPTAAVPTHPDPVEGDQPLLDGNVIPCSACEAELDKDHAPIVDDPVIVPTAGDVTVTLPKF